MADSTQAIPGQDCNGMGVDNSCLKEESGVLMPFLVGGSFLFGAPNFWRQATLACPSNATCTTTTATYKMYTNTFQKQLVMNTT